jgi:hypothetical protein
MWRDTYSNKQDRQNESLSLEHAGSVYLSQLSEYVTILSSENGNDFDEKARSKETTGKT